VRREKGEVEEGEEWGEASPLAVGLFIPGPHPF
jgi:hypothetical protein